MSIPINKKIVCKTCSKEVYPTSYTQLYCIECGKENKRKKQSKREKEKRKNSVKIIPAIKKINCQDCGIELVKISSRHFLCEECAKERERARCREYRKEHFVPKGYNQKRENNNFWKTGKGWFVRWGKNFSNCSRCGSEKFICVHHIDRNRDNNNYENLEILCKRCHQEEHGAFINRDENGRFITHKV